MEDETTGWVRGAYGVPANDFTGDVVYITDGAIGYGDEDVVNSQFLASLGNPRLKRRVFNIEVEDFHTYYVGALGVWVHNTNCGGEGVVFEDPVIGLRPDSEVVIYGLQGGGADRGVILIKEQFRTESNAANFERQTEGALTTADGYSVPWSLRFDNGKPGLDVIRLGDGRQVMPDGSLSDTFIDAKSGSNGLGPLYDPSIPLTVRQKIQSAVLDNFRRVSEALAQNPGYSHIVEFQTKSAFDIATQFFSDVVAKAGYADNIMLRLRGADYLTGEPAPRGQEPVLTFDHSGNAIRVEHPTFIKASDGQNPSLDVANDFKKAGQRLGIAPTTIATSLGTSALTLSAFAGAMSDATRLWIGAVTGSSIAHEATNPGIYGHLADGQPKGLSGSTYDTALAHRINSLHVSLAAFNAESGDVMLVETSAQNAQFSEAFDVDQGDQFLSFTVSQAQLVTNDSGPGDAFEAALLDAVTGEAITGISALSHSDAMLNIQTDGAERLSSNVRKLVNADGSATYLVTLPAALVGKSVYLSFDLLGFGAAQSHVSLRDIQLVRDSLAIDDAVSGDEDTVLSGDVRGNDIVLGSLSRVELVGDGPVHGVLGLDADGRFGYRPVANYFGSDSFSYHFVDADGHVSNTALVTLVIRPMNDAPTAPIDRTLTVRAGELVAFDPLAGATDVEGSPLSPEIVRAPQHGTVEPNADGSYSYIPQRSYSGTDSFTYRVSDGELSSPVAMVSVNVLPVVNAPVARDLVLQLLEDGDLMIDPSSLGVGTLGESIDSTVVVAPSHGTLVVEANGQWRYTPAADFNGADSLRFQLSEGGLVSNAATLIIHIIPVNDAPVLNGQTFALGVGGSVTIDPLLTASDVDGDPLTAGLVTQATHGHVTVGTDGRFRYVATAGYVGSDSFSYRVNDGQLDSAIATVSLAIAAANQPPVASDSLAVGTEDTLVVLKWSNFAITAGSAEVTGVVIASLPIDGTLQQRQDDGSWVAVVVGATINRASIDAGALRFTPAANASGGAGNSLGGDGNRHLHYARFAYKAAAGVLASNEASVVIDIAAVADAPSLGVASPGAASGLEDEVITLPGITAALSDADGSEALVLTLTGLPIGTRLSDGTKSFVAAPSQLVVNLAGWNIAVLQLTPPLDFNGRLTVQIQATAIEASTGERATKTHDLIIDVAAVADAPQLTLTGRDVAVSRELLATSWETTANASTAAAVVNSTSLEGWSVIASRADRTSAFEVWASGDRMRNAGGNLATVRPMADDGDQWLSLNNGLKTSYQTLGIERSIGTIDGAVYTLTLDYAGSLGLAIANTQIGIYLDGQLIGNYANTSAMTVLNWQALSFQFGGNGLSRTLSIRLEGGDSIATTRAAMIDDLRIVETLPNGTTDVYGLGGKPIAIPQINAQLSNPAGGEVLRVELAGLAAGSLVTDGVRSYLVPSTGVAVGLSGWNLSRLSLAAPAAFIGTMQLAVRVTAIEPSNGSVASVQQAVTVHVLSGIAVATPVGVNPFATMTPDAASRTPVVADATPSVTAGALTLAAGPVISSRGQLTFNAGLPRSIARTPEEDLQDEDERAQVLTDAWLVELEQSAQAQWRALAATT